MTFSVSWVTIVGVLLYFTGALGELGELIQSWFPSA